MEKRNDASVATAFMTTVTLPHVDFQQILPGKLVKNFNFTGKLSTLRIDIFAVFVNAFKNLKI